jgi:hypothetical protein
MARIRTVEHTRRSIAHAASTLTLGRVSSRDSHRESAGERQNGQGLRPDSRAWTCELAHAHLTLLTTQLPYPPAYPPPPPQNAQPFHHSYIYPIPSRASSTSLLHPHFVDGFAVLYLNSSCSQILFPWLLHRNTPPF